MTDPGKVTVNKAGIHQLHIEVNPQSEHGFWVGVAEGGGGRGVFVATDQPLEVGANVALTLILEGQTEPQRIRTRVQWAVPDPGDGSVHGMGLAFISPDQQQMAALQLYFRTHKPDLVRWNKVTNELKQAIRQRKTIHSMPVVKPLEEPQEEEQHKTVQHPAATTTPYASEQPAAPAPEPAPEPTPEPPTPVPEPVPKPPAAAPAPEPPTPVPEPVPKPPAGAPSDRKLTIEIGTGSEHALWLGFEEDIGSGGIFVASRDVWALGQQVEMDLFIEGEKAPHSIQCRVRWIRPDLGPDTPPGIGLDIVGEPYQPLQALRRYIHKHDPEILFWDED